MSAGLLVMKFGGTSMGSAERICAAAEICREQSITRPILAVVSAMSGVTDLLLNTLRHAEGGDEKRVEANVQQLLNRHLETCAELGIRDPAVFRRARSHRRFRTARKRNADAGRPASARGG